MSKVEPRGLIARRVTEVAQSTLDMVSTAVDYPLCELFIVYYIIIVAQCVSKERSVSSWPGPKGSLKFLVAIKKSLSSHSTFHQFILLAVLTHLNEIDCCTHGAKGLRILCCLVLKWFSSALRQYCQSKSATGPSHKYKYLLIKLNCLKLLIFVPFLRFCERSGATRLLGPRPGHHSVPSVLQSLHSGHV